MDNRIFNINGRTKNQLDLAVKAFMLDEYNDVRKITGWYFSEEKGLVLTWLVKDSIKPFTNKLGEQADIINPLEISNILWEWLESDDAKLVKLIGWDADTDHDGDNEKGWRLYTDGWGCIKESNKSMDHYSLGAFTPAWLWYGK